MNLLIFLVGIWPLAIPLLLAAQTQKAHAAAESRRLAACRREDALESLARARDQEQRAYQKELAEAAIVEEGLRNLRRILRPYQQTYLAFDRVQAQRFLEQNRN